MNGSDGRFGETIHKKSASVILAVKVIGISLIIDDGRKNTIRWQLVSVLSPIGIHVEQYWKDNLIEVHPENFC